MKVVLATAVLFALLIKFTSSIEYDLRDLSASASLSYLQSGADWNSGVCLTVSLFVNLNFEKG
jgi:hypothetical protein